VGEAVVSVNVAARNRREGEGVGLRITTFNIAHSSVRNLIGRWETRLAGWVWPERESISSSCVQSVAMKPSRHPSARSPRRSRASCMLAPCRCES